MMPFLSSVDVLLAAGVMTAPCWLAAGIYLLARRQRPASAGVQPAVQVQAPAEDPAGNDVAVSG